MKEEACKCGRRLGHPGLCKAKRRIGIKGRIGRLLKTDFAHGTLACYNAKKCRCEPCRTANREYERERAKKLARGITNRVISARRVREHLLALSAQGIGYKTVADAAQVGKTILQEVRSGRRKHVRQETERRVLAVKAEDVTHDRILVDAASTRQLIDELVAEGYAKAQLARWLGSKTPALQIADREKVRARTALDVERLYIRLKRQPQPKSRGGGRLMASGRTWRLIDQLLEDGYSQKQLSEWLGVKALPNRHPHVRETTARRIAHLYQRIHEGFMRRAS